MSKLTPGWQRTSVLEAVFDQLSDALVLYDPDFDHRCEPRCRKTLRHVRRTRCWANTASRSSSAPSASPTAACWSASTRRPPRPTRTVRLHTDNGMERLVVMRTKQMFDDDGQLDRRGRHYQGHHRRSRAAEARGDRRIGRHARDDEFRAPRGRQRSYHHPAGRRERHGQGPDRQDAALPERAPGGAFHRHQLRRHSGNAAGKRIVRLRKGRFHRRALPETRHLRTGRQGHALPRRDRRDSPDAAGQTAACSGRADASAAWAGSKISSWTSG